MARKSAALTIVCLTATLGGLYGFAQAPTQTAAPAPAAQQGPAQTMDLESAKKIAAATVAAAAAANQKVAVCVMDTNGDAVLTERMDGSGRGVIGAAQAKARGALLFGVPTGQISDANRAKKPVTATLNPLPLGAGGEVALIRGGLPIMKDGKLIGAVGAGGSTAENDEKFAQAGLDAFTGAK